MNSVNSNGHDGKQLTLNSRKRGKTTGMGDRSEKIAEKVRKMPENKAKEVVTTQFVENDEIIYMEAEG